MLDNERIAKNTMLLYFRMAFLLCISLYTTRVVIKALGIDDYGIYNVVGGFVTMFSFLNVSLSAGTSRYIAYALGAGDDGELMDVVSTCKLAHLIIAIFVLFVGETLGLWFVLTRMQIPPDRMTAALWVYQCSVLASVIMIWSVPYNALIIAYERMSAFAYISVFEAVLKLSMAYVIMLNLGDNLIIYAVLLMVSQLLVRMIYTTYCGKKMEVAIVSVAYHPRLFKELLSFSVWNLWGSLASVLSSQGLNVLLNIFFGTAVNAARGISITLRSAVLHFSGSFQTALNPQIIKSYASGDDSLMHSLICRGSKFTFMLLFCICLPIMLEVEFILVFWLAEVPKYTSLFIRIILCNCIIDVMANPFMTGMAATGNIKFYQSVTGGLLIAIVPIAYVVLLCGGVPASVFYVQFIISLIVFIVKMYIACMMLRLSLRQYFRLTIQPCLLVGVVCCAIMFTIKSFLPESVICSMVIIGSSVIFSMIIVYFMGLTSCEQFFVKKKLSVMVMRLRECLTSR